MRTDKNKVLSTAHAHSCSQHPCASKAGYEKQLKLFVMCASLHIVFVLLVIYRKKFVNCVWLCEVITVKKKNKVS